MRKVAVFLVIAFLVPTTLDAQGEFQFEVDAQVETTPVQNQARTGTCWSFASSSFLETELIRMGRDPVDISEMFFVRMNYPQKVQNYLRYHGSAGLGQGSLAGDVMRAVRLYGIVPEGVYPGHEYGGEGHDHSELHRVLKASADALLESRALSTVWQDAVGGILDAYLGDIPEEFTWQGRQYTPRTFADHLGIDPNDYVELTSFTHQPFDTWFALEIPDNWARNPSYNVPLDEMMSAVDRALENGYSVDWDGDVSERSFCHANGVAVLPAVPYETRDQESRGNICTVPEPEADVTQAVRQAWFDDHTSTDDHLMHLVGIAHDQNGTKYYLTKNSWGETGALEGYLYMSEAYVRAKTISITVHRDALTRELRQRVAGG
jgi:bleomycin hydrolase